MWCNVHSSYSSGHWLEVNVRVEQNKELKEAKTLHLVEGREFGERLFSLCISSILSIIAAHDGDSLIITHKHF